MCGFCLRVEDECTCSATYERRAQQRETGKARKVRTALGQVLKGTYRYATEADTTLTTTGVSCRLVLGQHLELSMPLLASSLLVRVWSRVAGNVLESVGLLLP